jgi:fructokinase
MPDIIAIGELLIDLISTEYAEDFSGADRYQRLAGGSPANLAMNMARLGCDVSLVATVGADDAGSLLINTVKEAGVNTDGIVSVAEPTTLILVTKSQAVSNFEPYRLADKHITTAQLTQAGIAGARLVHTTAFALSLEPARTAILEEMAAAARNGVQLSTDFNYADKIWGNNRQAGLNVLTQLAELGAFVKVSEVDFERLFGESATEDHHAAAQRIFHLGANLVCLTLGEDGCYVMTADEHFHLPARKVDVKDTTGAGDAFWSGFLAAWLKGKNLRACALSGRALAELKLTRVGPVLNPPSIEALIEEQAP